MKLADREKAVRSVRHAYKRVMSSVYKLMSYELEANTALGRNRYRDHCIVTEARRLCRQYGLNPTRGSSTARESAGFLVWLALKDEPGFRLSEASVNGIWTKKRVRLFANAAQHN